MLENLRLVSTALAQRDVVPALIHLHVKSGRAQAYNGRLAIEVPAPFDFDATVHGAKFLAAMDAAAGEGKVTIKDSTLTVSRGRFRVRIPCIDPASYPASTPGQMPVACKGPLRPAFQRLREFISTDASRPWSMGLLLTEGVAYATNNVVLCRMPCDMLALPGQLNVPVDIVDAVLARGADPVSYSTERTALTLIYEDEVWFRTQLFTAEWPVATVTNLFANAEQGDWQPIPDELRQAFELVKKFDDGGVPTLIFKDGNVVDDSGHVLWDGFDALPADTRFNVNMTLPVLSCTTEVKWHHNPGVHMFRDGEFYAIVAGMRA
jgi:hypothetical protein